MLEPKTFVQHKATLLLFGIDIDQEKSRVSVGAAATVLTVR